MLKIRIKRIFQGIAGTFGTIHCNNVPFALTGELPWIDNLKNISCIPSGNYKCKRVHSPKFGDTFEIIGVENRTHILFHKGNLPLVDSEGCILIGESFDYLDGSLAVLSSAKGFNEFIKLTINENMLELTIENHWIF